MTSLRILLEAQNFRRIALKKLNTGHYKLSIKVNKKRGDFILDTGASTSCIGFENIAHFILESEVSEIKAAGAGAVDMETMIARGNQLDIGGLHFSNINLILFDMSHVNNALEQVDEERVHGILGADLLKSMRAVIDYGRNCVYIK